MENVGIELELPKCLSKEDVILQIIEDFPLMALWDDGKYWSGFIVIQGTLVRLAVKAPNFPSSTDVKIEGDADSTSMFASNKIDLKKVAESAASVYNLMKKLEFILSEDIEVKVEGSTASFDALFYTNLLSELELIGLRNIEYAAVDFREVHARYYDSTERKHLLKFMLPSRYPHSAAKVIDELPSSKANSYTWPTRIFDAYTQFTSMVETYLQFWKEMDDIDKSVRVIDPQEPNRSHTHRRILINEKNILQIVLNPLKPRSFPEFVFSGPDMEEFTKEVDERYSNWKESLSVIENFQSMLAFNFLPKDDTKDEQVTEITCTICYAYELDDETPETVCDCGSAYHNKCLYELFLNECSKKGLRRCVGCPVCDLEIKISSVHQSNNW